MSTRTIYLYERTHPDGTHTRVLLVHETRRAKGQPRKVVETAPMSRVRAHAKTLGVNRFELARLAAMVGAA